MNITPRAILKSFLPGQQHVAELMIEKLRAEGYAIVPVKATPEIAQAGRWERNPAVRYGEIVAVADAGVR